MSAAYTDSMTRILCCMAIVCCLACDDGLGTTSPVDTSRGITDLMDLDSTLTDTGIVFLDMAIPIDVRPPVLETDMFLGQCRQDSDCDDEVFCNGIERCSNNRCYANPIMPCDDSIGCTRDVCDENTRTCETMPDDGACPENHACDLKLDCFPITPCQTDEECDDGSACNGIESCQMNRCAPGLPTQCDDDIACTVDVCVDGTGACEYLPVHGRCIETQLCSVDDGCIDRPPCMGHDDCDDGSFCNGRETCDQESGACRPGIPPVVDDGIPCTIDVCSDRQAMVIHTPTPARCTDGQFCNGAEICHPRDGCLPGEPPAVSDGIGCTIDRCNEELDFIEHEPDPAACDDDLFCNGEEVCHPIDGCQPGEPPVINDGIGCTVDSCSEVDRVVRHRPNDASCDDGLFCNGAELCTPEIGCQPGPEPIVDDDIDCTEDLCDEVNDQITHRVQHNLCSDGLFCNGSEVCDQRLGCTAGEMPELDDSIPCTADRCDEVTDQIIHAPRDESCDDGSFCNGRETCDVARGCTDGMPPAIDDGIPCTLDRCNEGLDLIEHTPTQAACDDGLFCNGSETCDVRDGCQPGIPPNINDGVGCTVDSCSEVERTVRHIPNDEQCNDQLFCNGNERCDPVRDCQPGIPPETDDGLACTIDSCDEVNDRTVHEPRDERCDDGLFCNGVEACDSILGCVNRPPPTLDDGIPCTDDQCDEAENRVVHIPQNVRCDDGLFCNGRESCDPGAGCIAGIAPRVDDGIHCTIDRCDEVLDLVSHTPQSTRCDDSLFCNGVEQCDAAQGCLAGPPPELDDGLPCTVDRCDESNDRIVHVADDGQCDDGVFCNGAETCSVLRGCEDGVPPTVDDDIRCTQDRCDEFNDRIVNQPNHALCDNGSLCDGTEVCDLQRGCLDGEPPADGTVCRPDPRSICLNNGCDLSRCGDGFVDVNSGEECEDGNLDGGDGCSAVCRDEAGGGGGEPMDGVFDVLPAVNYSCGILGIPLVEVRVSSLGFLVGGGRLAVSATPGPKPPTMTMSPAPPDLVFTVEGEHLGGCSEFYQLSGAFDNVAYERWSGTLEVCFEGPDCGFTDCTGCRSFPIVGTRAE